MRDLLADFNAVGNVSEDGSNTMAMTVSEFFTSVVANNGKLGADQHSVDAFAPVAHPHSSPSFA